MSTTTVIIALAAGLLAYQAGIFDKIFGNIGGGGTPGGGGSTPPPAGGGGSVSGQLKFASVGDIEQEESTAITIAGSGASVALINGDFYYSGDPQEWWDTVMAPVHGIKTYATIGNHDSESDAALFGQQSFNMSWKEGPVAFVSVNTESLDEAFVKGELDKYQADATVGAIIPFMHKPVFTPEGSHHGAENTGLVDLFAQYSKVKLVLSGHNHNYSRSKPQGQGGQVYVTVGTGGRDGNTGYPVQLDSNHDVAFAGTMGILVCDYNNGSMSCNFTPNSGGSGDTDSFTVQYAATTTPPATTPPAEGGDPAEDDEEESNYTRAYMTAVDMAKFQYTHDPKKYPDLYRPVTSIPISRNVKPYNAFISFTGRRVNRKSPRRR